jgi:hypothetical protein
MLVFNIIPTKKTVDWLKANGLNICAMQYALTMLYSDIMPCKRVKKKTIILQTDYKSGSSAYTFGTNKIFICSDPYMYSNTKRQKKFIIFLHFLHEFRHWMQSRVFKVSDSQIKYTQEDVDNNTKRYRNNRFEKDATKFEKQYVRKFMRYYQEYLISYL